MTDVRTHTRRPPQPPIDPALVVPGSRWIKNRADYRDKPPVFDVVDTIEELTGASGTTKIVHYHREDTGRRGSMPLRDFCQASEHRAVDDAPEPAETSPRPDEAPATVADIRAMNAKLDEILARLSGPRQLRLVGS